MYTRRNNATSIGKDKWIRCVRCGHKLGKSIAHSDSDDCIVEIKCHSCKTINICMVNKEAE